SCVPGQKASATAFSTMAMFGQSRSRSRTDLRIAPSAHQQIAFGLFATQMSPAEVRPHAPWVQLWGVSISLRAAIKTSFVLMVLSYCRGLKRVIGGFAVVQATIAFDRTKDGGCRSSFVGRTKKSYRSHDANVRPPLRRVFGRASTARACSGRSVENRVLGQ